MNRYAIPAPINGPTATPLNKATDSTVPSTKAAVICGLVANRFTPPFANRATAIPDNNAIQATGVFSASNKCLKPISPVAIGTNTAIVMTVTPKFIPFDCKYGNTLSPISVYFSINNTIIEIIKELFLAMIPINNRMSRNIVDSLIY